MPKTHNLTNNYKISLQLFYIILFFPNAAENPTWNHILSEKKFVIFGKSTWLVLRVSAVCFNYVRHTVSEVGFIPVLHAGHFI